MGGPLVAFVYIPEHERGVETAEARVCPSGEKATQERAILCPCSEAEICPLSMFQTRSKRSAQPDANIPSGEKAIEVTGTFPALRVARVRADATSKVLQFGPG